MEVNDLIKEPARNTIKSAYKVFYLLEILTDYGNLSLGELSKITGFTRSTTQRIVNTLSDLKYIVQDDKTLHYYPSIKLYQLGKDVLDYFPIKKVAQPYLLELYKETNETINLAILDDNKVVYLDKLVSTSPLRVELKIGSQFPIYSSALGKSMAAFDNRQYSFEGEYEKYTENTLSSDKELYDEFRHIREVGYAIDNEEYLKGLICISVPIFDNHRSPIAGVSISIPTIRYNEDDLLFYVNLLEDCTSKIEKELF